jgi:hypothetical protein
MEALVLAFTYVVNTKHIAQSIGIIGYNSSPVDQAHALRCRLGGRCILDAAPKLFDRG